MPGASRRELRFAMLSNSLAAFMRLQNPSILTNIGQCVEQAICTLPGPGLLKGHPVNMVSRGGGWPSPLPVPTPTSSAGLFETLLHAFLHSIRLAKISAVYRTRPGRGGLPFIMLAEKQEILFWDVQRGRSNPHK